MNFNKILQSLFGNKSTRDMKLIQPIVEKIKAEYPNIKAMNAVFLADKREVLSKFKNELLQIACDRLAKVTLGILLRQIKKFKHIGIKDAASHILRDRFGYQLLGGKHITLIDRKSVV